MTTPIDGTSAPPARLPGFDYQRIDVKDVTINCAVRGRAPPLLLLHGYYRSAVDINLAHDEESFAAGQKIECPVLALWGEHSFVGRGYDPLSVWQQYAPDVRGNALPVGHFLPEEAPDLVTAALRDFFD